MTLQRRVLGYLALAAIVSCALTFGVAVVLVRHKIATQRIGNLQSEANVLAVLGGVPGALAAGEHVYRIGPGTPRRVRPAIRDKILAATPPGDAEGTIDVAGRSLLYVARTTAAGRIVLVRGALLAFADWRPFLVSLALAGLGGVLVAVLLSFLLARRLTRPIRVLSGAAQRLAAGESPVEIPVQGEDELSDLGRTFNGMSIELARARESQRSFLESVSHELKTPLTSIRGYAEALDEGAVSSSEGGRVIAGEADRLQRLVFDLLDLARFGRSDFAVGRDPVNLATVVDAAVSRHLPRARALGVALTSASGAAAWGVGDEDRLLQATSNLIENALRLTPAGGSVDVEALADQIFVRDTGPGLATEDLPHAFERFYLYDRYRSERSVGSGLGLAIVKELISAMGGGVKAASRPGGGAEFALRVPRPAPSQ